MLFVLEASFDIIVSRQGAVITLARIAVSNWIACR